jgi:hypothetical protein
MVTVVLGGSGVSGVVGAVLRADGAGAADGGGAARDVGRHDIGDAVFLTQRDGSEIRLDRIRGPHLYDVLAEVMRRNLAVTELIQATVGYHDSTAGARVNADAAVLRIRRIVDAMLASERGQASRFGAGPALHQRPASP